jgi:hypothetical protein
VAAFFLVTEHWAHVIPYLPFVLFLLRPLMHIFMHGGQEIVIIRLRTPLTGYPAESSRAAIQETLLTPDKLIANAYPNLKKPIYGDQSDALNQRLRPLDIGNFEFSGVHHLCF